MFLGFDWYTRSTKDALEVAKTSNHPDAQWFCSIGGSLDMNDPRATLWNLILDCKFESLRTSPFLFGRLFFVLYCTTVTPQHSIIPEIESIEYDDDPYLLFMIGVVFLRASWYHMPEYRKKALQLFHLSATMGCNAGIQNYAEEAELNIDDRIKWFGKIVKNTGNFFSELRDIGTKANTSNSSKWLLGKIFSKCYRYDYGKQWVSYYEYNRNKSIEAIRCWLLCAHRLNSGKILLNRDIRRQISILIWKSQKEGLYCPPQ